MGQTLFGVEQNEQNKFVPIISIKDSRFGEMVLSANLSFTTLEEASEVVKYVYVVLTGEQRNIQYSSNGELIRDI